MKNTYYVPSQTNPEEFDKIVNKLKADFQQIVAGEATEEEVIDYVKALLTQGQEDERTPGMIFWRLADPRSMPADCRTIYVYETTYYATGIIIYALRHYEGAQAIPDVKEVLAKALSACMGRKFLGAGYDSEIGFLHTMKIFAQCGMDRFIEAHPKLNPRFTMQFTAAMFHLEQDFLTGQVKDAWSGKDYIAQAEEVMQAFEANA